MSKKLKVGVIGLGMGRHHIEGFQRHPRAKVTAIADIDPDLLEQKARESRIKHSYEDYQKMLAKEELDIVSIATPNYLHLPISLAAFRAGCHVLCEKPMALNTAEAKTMLAASQEAGKRLMINFSYRFTPQSMALRRQVEEGVLGQIYYARTVWLRRRGIPRLGSWFGQKKYSGGGPLIDLGVHRLDLALWLIGYPRPVYVVGNCVQALGIEMAKQTGKPFDVEDFAAGYVQFENGATLCLEASWASNIKEQELMETRLFGTKGGARHYNLDEGYEFAVETYVEKEGFHYDMQLHDFPVSPLYNPMYHFVDAIVNDRPHIATGEEGVIVMEILDALYQSAETGRPVQIVPN
jgi:predicted dehydrogenase